MIVATLCQQLPALPLVLLLVLHCCRSCNCRHCQRKSRMGQYVNNKSTYIAVNSGVPAGALIVVVAIVVVGKVAKVWFGLLDEQGKVWFTISWGEKPLAAKWVFHNEKRVGGMELVMGAMGYAGLLPFCYVKVDRTITVSRYGITNVMGGSSLCTTTN